MSDIPKEILAAIVGLVGLVIGSIFTYLGVRNSNRVRIRELEVSHSLEMQAQHIDLARQSVADVHVPLAAALARLSLGIEKARAQLDLANDRSKPTWEGPAYEAARVTVSEFIAFTDKFYTDAKDIYLLEPTSVSLTTLVAFLSRSREARRVTHRQEGYMGVFGLRQTFGEPIPPGIGSSVSVSYLGIKAELRTVASAAPVLSPEFDRELLLHSADIKRTLRSVILGVPTKK